MILISDYRQNNVDVVFCLLHIVVVVVVDTSTQNIAEIMPILNLINKTDLVVRQWPCGAKASVTLVILSVSGIDSRRRQKSEFKKKFWNGSLK